MKLFTIYDSKAQIYHAPFTQRSTADAIRGFEKASKDQDSNIGRYPEDFVLFHIGDFDDASCSLVPNNAPVSIARATEFTTSL